MYRKYNYRLKRNFTLHYFRYACTKFIIVSLWFFILSLEGYRGLSMLASGHDSLMEMNYE